jgi:hypothetical protein
MDVDKCALGVIQARGQIVVAPEVVALGPSESDYFVRHVRKVRQFNDATPRTSFITNAVTVGYLRTLRDARQDADYAGNANALMQLLSDAMKAVTNPKDCVFAAVRTTDARALGSTHVTLLKLDAVIEAARLTRLQSGGISFEVLHDLLPEPGDLQKGLSWPDPRTDSDALTVDRNGAPALYFEDAFQLQVSMRSQEAEKALINAITDRLEPEDVPGALERVAQAEGGLANVLADLSADYPALSDAAAEQAQDPRPAGTVRPGKATERPLVWTADGIEVVVPTHLLGNVRKARLGDRWQLVVTSATEPTLGPR